MANAEVNIVSGECYSLVGDACDHLYKRKVEAKMMMAQVIFSSHLGFCPFLKSLV